MQPSQSTAGVSVPSDLVTVGYISGAYGIQGWVRVKPYSADADALLGAKTWWLDKPELRDVEMMQAGTLVVGWERMIEAAEVNQYFWLDVLTAYFSAPKRSLQTLETML